MSAQTYRAGWVSRVDGVNFLDLGDVAPGVEPDFENYARCEREILTPAIRAAGFHTDGIWFTGDGDSFGPLTRCITTDRGVVVYG